MFVLHPFANYTGVVKEIDVEKGKMTVDMQVFGRFTPVECDFNIVEKV